MFSGRGDGTTITEHCVWSHDDHMITKDVSHLKLIAMSLLQTCGYITDQMQPTVSIDVNKLLESFSIKDDRGDIHPPLWMQGKTILLHFLLKLPLFPTPNLFLLPHLQSLSPWRIIVGVDGLKPFIGSIFKRKGFQSWLAFSQLNRRSTRNVGML